MKKKVVGLGEVLWDLLPDRTCLGGAPANFAYITTLMGDQGIVASRVGEDSRGLDALRRMEELKVDIDHVQTDRERPTGSGKSGTRSETVLLVTRSRSPLPGIFYNGLSTGSTLPRPRTRSVSARWRQPLCRKSLYHSEVSGRGSTGSGKGVPM